MKNLLLGLFFVMGVFWIHAQSSQSPTKSFVAFAVSEEHTDELKQLEILLKNNQDYEMVRVDYSRNIVFIVSVPGVSLTENSLRNISGDSYHIIRCTQYGVQGVNAVNFDELYPCNSN